MKEVRGMDELTVDELAVIMEKYFYAKQKKQVEMMKRFQEFFGGVGMEVPVNDISEIEAEVIRAILKATAYHLKNGDNNLLTDRDIMEIASETISRLPGSDVMEGDEIDFARSLLANILKGTKYLLIHEDWQYRRSIEAIFEISKEKGISPEEFLSREEAIDEITRRMFDRNEFVVLIEREFKELIEEGIVDQIMLQPLLGFMGGKEKKEVENTMAEMRGVVEVAWREYMKKEVARLYGSS